MSFSEDMDKQNNRLTPSSSSKSLNQDKKDHRNIRSSKDVNLSRNDSFPSRFPNASNTTNNGRHTRASSTQVKNLSKEIASSSSFSNSHELLGFYYDDEYSVSQKKRGGHKPNFKLWNNFNSRKVDEITFYNKEQFIQANCQFVVDPTMDHSVHLIDPDVIVDWSEVLQVRIMSHEVPQCPICLYPPVSARMTKCGHIYCWPCALQYISYENEVKSKKCAICCEHIYPDDLKSVIAKSRHNFTDGDEITMVLMHRNKGFTQALPIIEGDIPPPNVPLEAGSESETSAGFAKLLICNVNYQIAMIEQDLNELVGASLDGDNETIQPYIESLIENLKQQLKGLHDIKDNPYPSECVLGDAKRPNRLTRKDSNSDNCATSTALTVLEPPSPLFKCVEAEGAAAQPVRKSQRTSVCEDDSFYFYQGIDGQHIYLHSLNWKCLATEYGSIDNWPREITGKILQVEHISMSAAIRKRYRYLSHLPLTCAVSVVELELCPHVVSRETITQYEPIFRKRHKERKEKEKYDRYLTKRKEKEENKFTELKTGALSASTLSNQEKIVPEFDEHDFMPLTRDTSTCNQNASAFNSQASFASMLKSPLNGQNTAPKPPFNWSSPSPANCRPDRFSQTNVYENETDELSAQFAPPVASSFGEMLSSALDAQLSLNSPTSPTEPDSSKPNQNRSKKKGKKSKGIVLFSI